jgi:hypothetical protein
MMASSSAITTRTLIRRTFLSTARSAVLGDQAVEELVL